MFFKILWFFLAIYGFFVFLESLICHGSTFDYYFGIPGSGKTTFAAWLSKRRLKRKGTVHSNVNIKGTYKLEKSDIGKYDISKTLMILDESGIEFNNRDYKNQKEALTKEQIAWFKLHRHYKVDIAVFSQSHLDTDVTLRRLSSRYYLLKKSIIPFFISRKEIVKFLTIEKENHQLIDGYKFRWLFGRRLIFAPSMWKMFNSYEAPELPKKEWIMY